VVRVENSHASGESQLPQGLFHLAGEDVPPALLIDIRELGGVADQFIEFFFGRLGQ
jgi:hypothetical protein